MSAASSATLYANARATDREECFKAGMNDHIAKPIKPEILYKTLVRQLRPDVDLTACVERIQPPAPVLPDLDGGKIAVDGTGRTSVDGIWAGGDCATGGDDLTVTAVAEGRDAAEDIHASLVG